MESDYDRKFEDMKKYIPFLESMIKRLESTSSLSANPRQAQLDKIRSLRDLLLDKKKRMKMENLLKCEQVLINLYAKVEQRDTLPNTKKTSNTRASDFLRTENSSELEIVRNKLKRVSKIQEGTDTLPEIIRASDVEDICTTGSVEPALFQRRPHKKSPSLSDISSSSQEKPKSPDLNSKRKYTRVLYSPEPDSRVRSSNQETSLDSVLFSRRSPKKSTTSHNKREGKKNSNHKTSSTTTKDLNITLNVPEESLNSLNTKDILSRIITCNDNDVDIKTLRGLRTQILSELKQTGTNDDISDLILKSYTGKKSTTKAKEEIEEGELSDSESEAIESIYGSLVLMDKDNTKKEVGSEPEVDQSRKIQICLVINSKENEISNTPTLKSDHSSKEECELEMFSETKINKTESKSEQKLKVENPKSMGSGEITSDVVIIDDDDKTLKGYDLLKALTEVSEIKKDENKTTNSMVKTGGKVIETNEANEKDIGVTGKETNDTIVQKESSTIINDVSSKKTNEMVVDKIEANLMNTDVASKYISGNVDNNEATVSNKDVGSLDIKQNDKIPDVSVKFKANFYKPLLDEENTELLGSTCVNHKENSHSGNKKISPIDVSSIIAKNECVKIPLLNEPVIPNKPVEKDIDSQIDILQALKNEILGDNILPEPSLDVITPPLHQPKATKVLHTQGTMAKKRISIEKYKEKSTAVTHNPCINRDTIMSPLRDDNVKKQSLKLTEKECERFNFPTKVDVNDDVSSEDEDRKESQMPSDELYKNFAPKSPDNDETHFDATTQPVIIPIDPIKASVVNFKADVDMRTLPLLSPKEIPITGNITSSSSICQKTQEIKKHQIKLDKTADTPDTNQLPLMNTLFRIDLDPNQSSNFDSTNHAAMNFDKASNSVAGPNANFTPNMTPSMTPSSRGFATTPSRFNDFDGNSSQKHVYAPSFSSFDSRDVKEHSILNDVYSPRDSETGRRRSRWEDNDYDSRNNTSQYEVNTQRSRYGGIYNLNKNNDILAMDKSDDSNRGHGHMTPLSHSGWSEGSSMPNPYGIPEGPVPLMMLNIGRPDGPSTPSHPFSRSDCPPALGNPFSMSDMPATPSHPFGRLELPMTPSHPFGRSDCPLTPSHPFGRSDVSLTPSPMLGRSECPPTPSHPFGRVDCLPMSNNPFVRMDFPGTPNHPFGMSDSPTTPSHPFGRSDCHPTPNHSFCRLECPQTPSHSFGMSECPTTPSHPFGRIDGRVTSNYNTYGRTDPSQKSSISQQYSKDPRLNRRNESRSQRDESDKRSYNDRGLNSGGSYPIQNRHFGRSESYAHHDRDDGGRSRSMSRNESSFGHIRHTSRENHFNQSNFAEDTYNYDNRSRHRESVTDDRYRQDRRVGRNQDAHENIDRSQSRARSIGRNDTRRTENENTVSVKPHAGRSFTIDTSVNSTFQDLLKKKGLDVLNQSFDSRKQRAASVGRSSIIEDKYLKNTCNDSVADDPERRSKNYRRASSVGRDLKDKHDNFQKVKTDFQNYQKQYRKEDEMTNNSRSEEKYKSKNTYFQNIKSTYNSTKASKPVYSPRRNHRDPRLRREHDDKSSHKNIRHSCDKNKYGINYSSDNLARGAVLDSRYGVKNYKIPKIKRPTDEKQEEDKSIDEKNETIEIKIKKDESKTISKREECPGRRLTRSSQKEKKIEVSDDEDTITVRKSKKAIIYDSSSDTETSNKDTMASDILSSDDEKFDKLKYLESNKSDQNSNNKQDISANEDVNKEMFSDNVPSDPVIDDINALIADLDNQIDNPKTESCEDFKDITFYDDLSNMSNIENISLSKENTFDALFSKDTDVPSKVINLQDEKDMKENVSSINTCSKTEPPNKDEFNNKSVIEPIEFNVNKNETDNVITPIINSESSTDATNVANESLQNSDENKTNTNNEAIVSTTESDKEIGNISQGEVGKPTESNDINYETSAADSTNEITSDKIKEHNVPDSTNDVQNEMNSLVSSSLSSADVPIKDLAESTLPQQGVVPPLDSISSILSILQDKSRIHELLSMLGDHAGDNDKIKRKLEKLSEIVSDDEEEASAHTANKPGDENISNKDGTIEVSSPITDVKVNVQSNDVGVNTKLENKERAIDDTANSEINPCGIEDEQLVILNAKEGKDDHDTTIVKKGKGPKKGKGRFTKALKPQSVIRAATGQIEKSPPAKKLSRELIKLREDIKEMFLTDEMLNSTGIRMCRLAKLVDEKSHSRKEDTPQDPKPVVLLEKFKDQENVEDFVLEKHTKKKPSPKMKRKTSASENIINEENNLTNNKLKSVSKNVTPKTKLKASSKQEDNTDPYYFEIDSVSINTIRDSESEEVSDSETNSLVSSKSFGSSEILADLQKKFRRKRRGKSWQTGIIKPKSKKKKQIKMADISLNKDSPNEQINMVIPDNECFIDKLYCFQKNVTSYSCRLCEYTGDDIVLHYKKQHPHTEIPLSRMNPVTAKEAIVQCQAVNFPAISKLSTDRYVCIFCFKEFSKNKAVLESFFWHVVSMHTGEYKQACSDCENESCSFNLDIPPPPKDNTGQLMGYLCDKCNFTQVSLENLKTHVIVRHNDEQTDVYTINLAVMTKKSLKMLAKRQTTMGLRVLRSSRLNQSDATNDHSEVSDNFNIELAPQNEVKNLTVKSDKKSLVPSMQAKIAFESEENYTMSDTAIRDHDTSIEIKQEDIETESTEKPSNISDHVEPEGPENTEMQTDSATEVTQPAQPDDVMAHAHFKVRYKESGAKEYVCCINGKENHYKTSLLISMKKHVQCKHNERWDGFCVLCKVIVTPQGAHDFRECLQHFLDKHIDELPVLEIATEVNDAFLPKISGDVTAEATKPYINVRPLNQLIPSPVESEFTDDTTIQFPKIQSVVSLGKASVDLPRSSPTYPPVLCTETAEEKQYRYEEWQADVMSKKHRVVLNAMMSEEKLIKNFKCTGRFCSFTTDNAENALLHATTHQRIGGEGALNCSYCDFDASNNGIDLVMHVFKSHGKCPYTCKLCFYRATSSQLVSSHISRLHSERHSYDAILHTTTIAAPVADDTNLMSREDAVPHYVCGHPSSEGDGSACNFRTYTPGQFGEHLTRHQPPYPCNMCAVSLTSASELVHHMKTHGLRLYQCTSCVFGADNETDMLAHASARHPDRLPQAYLRVVTSKDGSTEYRVLPRAFLNKLKASSRDVTSSDTDNPVREAERSLALEKLIGHTESVTSIEPIQTTDDCDDLATDAGIVEDSEVLMTENIEQEPVPPPLPPPPPADRPRRRKSSIGAAEISRKSVDDNVSLIVKTEPEVKTPNIPSDTVIYCLDSDEEESRPRVIDVSDDDIGSTPTASTSQETCEYKKVPIDKLLKCPNCNDVFRYMSGFKRHLSTCMASESFSTTTVLCPHKNCTKQLNGVTDIADHYLKDHGDRKVIVFACGICKAKFKSVALTKKHMKDTHRSINFASNSPMTIQGHNKVYTVTELPQRSLLRRKSSSETVKQKRYGPQEIDQLPINPILESLVYCRMCEFNTKVRLNMVRHLQMHAEQQPVPHTAPVNPVPHLETNERHFDRMVNLASSSIVTRTPDKPTKTDTPTVSLVSDISRYPKYVPDRQRYTCGTKNCSYISVDEGMLRIHWETLHSNTSDYLCVHCPPHQHLDQSKPLTAARIVSHLKMHEDNLYACSACSYYHFKRVAVEKHLPKCSQMHKDRQVMVVREGGVTPTPAPVPPTPAVTAVSMDLKPWQCGLCSFKSMLRPEVADHSFKIHHSKMQYKCSYCPFRTSAVENVTKHQANAHPDKNEDVFYYYYREDSIPDDEDGTPRWKRQEQRSGITEPVVKSEIPEPSTSQCTLTPVTPAPVTVNLSLVKQEVEETERSDVEEGIEELCRRFGSFCEPSGIKYKCPLCTAVTEDTAEAMQSHLYEELKYRKWGCSVCSYKAFHKTGLNEHIKSEHYIQVQEPIQLPINVNVEKWVAGLLEYQTSLIEGNRQNAQAKEVPSTSKGLQESEDSLEDLEHAFGSFGTPRDNVFCCPKCSCSLKDESVMKEHLESELTKIRWCCSNCSFKSHTYHEAQFHCKSIHEGEGACPREAVRNVHSRAAWVLAVLNEQKHRMHAASADRPAERSAKRPAVRLTDPPDSGDNSLLVVRYEERVPTPEVAARRKRSAPDSDEEKLVIDESEPVAKKKPFKTKECLYCDFKTKWANALREHILRHYNLKPFKCKHCEFLGHRTAMVKHIEKTHPGQSFRMKSTPIPSEPPQFLALPKYNAKKVNVVQKVADKICLSCGKGVLEKDLVTHRHDDIVVEYAKKGDVVVKCCICLVLRLDVSSLQEHHSVCHPDVPVNYAYFKLHTDTLECHYCGYCNNRFSYLRDLRSHHRAIHSGLPLKHTTGLPRLPNAEEDSSAKRKNDDATIEPNVKRVARKSTTKLPHNTVAKKSTTKLPYSVSDEMSKQNEEFSFYGTKPPSLDEYTNVTTLMPFCNTLVPFTIKKLSEIIKIEPVVLVSDNSK